MHSLGTEGLAKLWELIKASFAQKSEIPTDYATEGELSAGLAKKADDYTVELYNGTGGNPKPVKFATVDYSTCHSEAGVAVRIGMVSGHGNGTSYAFLQEAIIRVNHSGGVEVDNAKSYGAEAPTYDGEARHYGDIFWVIDTTSKVVDLYVLMGQYARVYQTPWKRLTYSKGGTVTQYTSCTVYSSGEKVWANNSNVALASDIPTVPTAVSAFENDAGYLTEVPSEYVTDSELTAKGYLTAVPSEYVTESELSAKGYITSAALPTNYVSYTASSGVDVAGTTKATYAYGPPANDGAIGSSSGAAYFPEGIVMGGTAAAAGLVTRGVCGVSTPDAATGACVKEHLFVNYDGTNDYNSGRQLVLQAGSVGSSYGNNVWQYAAVRGDAMKAWVEAKGYAPTAAPTDVSGTETTTAKFNASNGGSIRFGKEGPNSGTMIRLDQEDGTCRLRFRASSTAGAMVWEQPEQGAALYVDLGKDGSDKHRVTFPSSAGTLALTSQIPTVPTNVSSLTNDAGYLTAVPSEYVTESELSAKGYLTSLPSHTHNYAGSSSAGGAATSANKLNANAGDSNTPVYFSNGVPVACTSLDLSTSGSSASCTGNAATATMPLGFASRTTGATWGNTVGTSFTCWNDPSGGSIDFRQDNPASGKVSMKVDGRVYVNEGSNPVMGTEHANNYWGMTSPDGESNVFIRTTSQGIIPHAAAPAGSGTCYLGTSTWYFGQGYIDNIYGTALGSDATRFQQIYGREYYFDNANASYSSAYKFGMYQWNDNFTFVTRNSSNNHLLDAWQIAGSTGVTNFLVRPTLNGAGLATQDEIPTDYAASSHAHAATDITSGVLPMANGGTGAALSPAANAIIRRSGSGNYFSTTATGNGAFYATSANGAPTFGTLPIAQGGTGATDAATALTNLGAAAASHTHSDYASKSVANTYNGEQKFQNSDYCPTVTDTASGVGCAFKASRGLVNELLADKLIMTASTGKLPIYTYGSASGGAMVSMAEVASFATDGSLALNGSLTAAGKLTASAGAKVSGRYAGAGDDEGLVIGKASNSYAGLCLGDPSGVRSVHYLMPDNSAVWRWNNGSTQTDVKHPGKAGTIALIEDLTGLESTVDANYGMQLYATCPTAAATAAKVATLAAGTLNLSAGAAVAVTFTYGNTADKPTLTVGGQTASIYTNGVQCAYWEDGATVSFVYTGSAWYVCSTPVYASTATIGNPAGGNVYIDGDSVDMRAGSTVNASFTGGKIELGKNSSSSTVEFCGGVGTVGVRQDDGSTDKITVWGDDGSQLMWGDRSGRWSSAWTGSNYANGDYGKAAISAGSGSSTEASIAVFGGFPDGSAGGTVSGKGDEFTWSKDGVSSTGSIHAGWVLYDNASGTSGTVTLSQSAALFEYLEVHAYSGSAKRSTSVRVSDPDGKTAALSILWGTSSANWEYRGAWAISGTAMTCSVNHTYNPSTSATASTATNEMVITKVVGYA